MGKKQETENKTICSNNLSYVASLESCTSSNQRDMVVMKKTKHQCKERKIRIFEKKPPDTPLLLQSTCESSNLSTNGYVLCLNLCNKNWEKGISENQYRF